MSIYAIPTPFAVDGLLYITSGYPADKIRPVYAIRSGAMGDISLKPEQTSNDFIVWSDLLIGPYNPSPLVYRGCYYTLLDRGFLTCHDPKTGKEIYGRQRITMDATSFTASLVGLQRQGVRAQRGRRHLRHGSRSGVQSPREELAR